MEISPKTAPTGHILVQKNLFLENTIAKITKTIIIPNIDKLNAEPKIVYGSIYLINKAEPPNKAPNVNPAIRYLTGISPHHNLPRPGKEFFVILLIKTATNSCKIPNGQIVEQ